jgi:iron(III) transport system permease protein
MSVSVQSLPASLSEAAGTLGAGPRRRFLTVQLPLLVPGLTAAGGLILLSVLKELPATLLLAPIGFQTLATKIWGAAGEGFLADAGAASLVLIALSGVLTWALVLRRDDASR